MKSPKQASGLRDLTVAVECIARSHGWRVCPSCGSLSIPVPNQPAKKRLPCIDCTTFTLTPEGDRDDDRRTRPG